ncbi:hypothetical protein SUGI_1322460 [Cryptomeria japonica]|uniref:Uncharacterized protein n=1 Tax=Cryptomeria japonica TaxID=3369 RepID=A0AAD3RPL7_CRYJA|nr:hypothetical protein SUGI_1322460 [Cryptomeria japonica]
MRRDGPKGYTEEAAGPPRNSPSIGRAWGDYHCQPLIPRCVRYTDSSEAAEEPHSIAIVVRGGGCGEMAPTADERGFRAASEWSKHRTHLGRLPLPTPYPAMHSSKAAEEPHRIAIGVRGEGCGEKDPTARRKRLQGRLGMVQASDALGATTNSSKAAEEPHRIAIGVRGEGCGEKDPTARRKRLQGRLGMVQASDALGATTSDNPLSRDASDTQIVPRRPRSLTA